MECNMDNILGLKRNLTTSLIFTVLALPVWSLAQSAPMAKESHMDTSKDMSHKMDSMDEKMKSMPMSGDVDYDFAMMMRIHHQGALDMAKSELDNGKNPEMRTMAKKIIAAQKKEIAQFDKWIAKHKKMDSMPAIK